MLGGIVRVGETEGEEALLELCKRRVDDEEAGSIDVEWRAWQRSHMIGFLDLSPAAFRRGFFFRTCRSLGTGLWRPHR